MWVDKRSLWELVINANKACAQMHLHLQMQVQIAFALAFDSTVTAAFALAFDSNAFEWIKCETNANQMPLLLLIHNGYFVSLFRLE